MKRNNVYEKPEILEVYYIEEDVVKTSGKDEYELPEF